MLPTIDIASPQARAGLDLQAAYNAGWQRCYVKLGGTNVLPMYVAPYYQSQIDACYRVGMKWIGHYWVPNANYGTPEQQADYFVDHLYRWDKSRCFVVLDNESLDDGVRYSDAQAAAWINRVKSRLGIPGSQVMHYSGWYDAASHGWDAVLGTGSNFIIADYRASSQPAFNFPDIPTVPRSRIVGHQTGGTTLPTTSGGVTPVDTNQFTDGAFSFAGVAGGDVTPLASAARSMYLLWTTDGTGWLGTEDGMHGLPSMQVYTLFKRLINSDQTASRPETFLRAEVEIMNAHLALLRVANGAQVTIDSVKLASALRDELVKVGIDVTVEDIANSKIPVDTDQLAAAFEAAVPRVAAALNKQAGWILSGLGE